MITAKELMEKLAKDEAYQEMMRKKKEKFLEADKKLVKEYEPFSRDCTRAGYSFETTWEVMSIANRPPN